MDIPAVVSATAAMIDRGMARGMARRKGEIDD
jgi:hypothetical protein